MVLDEEQRHPVRQGDLAERRELYRPQPFRLRRARWERLLRRKLDGWKVGQCNKRPHSNFPTFQPSNRPTVHWPPPDAGAAPGLTMSRSEEHTSELQSRVDI